MVAVIKPYSISRWQSTVDYTVDLNIKSILINPSQRPVLFKYAAAAAAACQAQSCWRLRGARKKHANGLNVGLGAKFCMLLYI